MQIKIKYHVDIPHIEKIPIGDWIDLRAAEDVFIQEREAHMISLGVSMELPEGYEAHIVPRSSTFRNFGLIMTNSFGVIDSCYKGDGDVWHFPAYCLRGKETKHGWWGAQVHKGDRICQFRIVKKQPELEFVEVETLGNDDRGGLGSTGV